MRKVENYTRKDATISKYFEGTSEMKEPHRLDVRIILAIYKQLLELFGGRSRVLETNKSKAAPDWALNIFHYNHPTIFDLAAGYADGIGKGHTFME